MPLWANKSIISRIIRRFQLEERRREPSNPLFLESIQPTTSADKLLITHKIAALGLTDPASTGWYIALTVPVGKRWLLYGYHAWKNSGATLTFTGVKIADATSEFSVDSFVADDNHNLVFPHPLPMDSGWTLLISVSAYTAGDIMQVLALIDEED